MMDILKHPNDTLRKTTETVIEITPELKELALEMLHTMKENKGIGLAAPQIGRSIRLLVMNVSEPLIMFNPIAAELSDEMTVSREGCLSFPGKTYAVERHKNVSAAYIDENGVHQNALLSDLDAICFQHELDHLSGILFIDRAF